jgi:hypothetical protein
MAKPSVFEKAAGWIKRSRVWLSVGVLALAAIGLAIAISTALGFKAEVDDLKTTVDGLHRNAPCSLEANVRPKKGGGLHRPINLTAEPAVGTLNFGTDRSTKSLYFAVKASRPLPKSLTPDQLEIAVPRPPMRVSDTLESASLELPRFSLPRIINGRKEIQFQMCVDASGIKPGTYTSQVFIGGPRRLHGTSVTAAITAKNDVFWEGGILVLLAAGALLVVMVRQDMKDSNPLLQVTTVVGSMVAAGAAMYTVYASDPAWGADPLTGIFALGGTAFGAAGLGSFVTTIFKHGNATSPGSGQVPPPKQPEAPAGPPPKA